MIPTTKSLAKKSPTKDEYSVNLDDRDTLDKYIGTVFTKQIAGFKPEITYTELAGNINKTTMKSLHIVDDENKKLPVQLNEFDPSIKFGRDSILYLKREVIEKLKQETRYNEDELKKLKEIYIKYAELGKGLNFKRFKSFIMHLYNIESHPFINQLFTYFDKNEDGLVEFSEMVMALNTIERGSFEEKVEFCFSVYDFRKKGYLDIFSLRELLKIAYVSVIVNLERALKKIRASSTANPRGFTWDEFTNLNVLDTILDNLPIVYDRMDYDKSMVDYLEKKFNFTLDGLERFWNIYKKSVTLGTNSEARKVIASDIGIKSPDMLSLNQFKLIMSDVFKVRNPQFLEELFTLVDKNKQTFVDIHEFIGGLVFFFSGPFEIKFALYCEVIIKMDKELILPKQHLEKLLNDALTHFKDVFDSAKKIADAMNQNLDGKITYHEFHTFCTRFPSAMDFLGRISLGEYPSPNEPMKAISPPPEIGKDTDMGKKSNFLSMENYEDILKMGSKYNFEEHDDSVTKRWVSRNVEKLV